MAVRECTIAGGLLLALCLARGAAAFEPAQQAQPLGARPSFSLPSFLNSERLPDLQEAWQTRDSGPKEQLPWSEQSSGADAVQPGEDESSESVRKRAEELSRRFGAGSAPAAETKASAPAAPPYAIGAEPSAERKPVADPVATSAPDAAGDEAPAKTEPMPADTTTAALPDDTPSKEPAKKAQAAHLNLGIPPLPARPPKYTESKPSKPSHSRVRRTRATTVTRATPPVNDAKREVFPPYLGAFGWDAKP